MEWGAEQIALAIVGALFLLGVVASLHPRFTLSLTSRIVLSPAPVATAAQPELGDEARSRIDRAMDPAASSAELEELAYTLPEARRAVASHAATPANVLSWLAAHGDDAVVAAIAARQESGNTTAIER